MVNVEVRLKGKSGLLKCSDKHVFRLLRENFSIPNPSFKSRRFVKRLYAITPIGAFQIGLWTDIKTYLLSLNVPLKFNLSEDFQSAFKPQLKIGQIEQLDGYEYYDHQSNALIECFQHGRGIVMIGTGGGKSLVIGGLVKNLKHDKILIIVPNVGLLNQIYQDLYNFGIDDCTRWGDGNVPDLESRVLIANIQSLTVDVKNSVKILENYGAVIMDEVHTLSEKKTQISKVVSNIKTNTKFGLTATLPDNLMSCWNVIGKIGPIIYEKNSYELRKLNAISEVDMEVLYCEHPKKPKYIPKPETPTENYEIEFDYIVNNKQRNNFIASISNKLKGNVLILVDRLLFIDELKDAFKTSDKKIHIVTGDIPTEERKAIQDQIEQTSDNICIAMSKCFSTGISINNLHYAVFAYIGKGGVKTVQSIGRMLRKHESKEKAIVYDIADNLRYSSKHLKARLQTYKKQKIKTKIRNIKL